MCYAIAKSFALFLTDTPFQNHDNQPNITHLEEIIREQAVAPLSYTRKSPKGVGGKQGQGTYWVPVSMLESGFTESNIFLDIPSSTRYELLQSSSFCRESGYPLIRSCPNPHFMVLRFPW
jgi:hypothetical protein